MSEGMNGVAGQGDALRQKVGEFLGLFFYGTLLKQGRANRMTDSPYGFGGRGEQAFAAQLDMELAQRMGRSARNPLGEAVCRELSPGARNRVHAS